MPSLRPHKLQNSRRTLHFLGLDNSFLHKVCNKTLDRISPYQTGATDWPNVANFIDQLPHMSWNATLKLYLLDIIWLVRKANWQQSRAGFLKIDCKNTWNSSHPLYIKISSLAANIGQCFDKNRISQRLKQHVQYLFLFCTNHHATPTALSPSHVNENPITFRLSQQMTHLLACVQANMWKLWKHNNPPIATLSTFYAHHQSPIDVLRLSIIVFIL